MRQDIYLMGVLPLIFFKIYMPQSQEYKAVKSLENAINDYNWSPRRFAEKYHFHAQDPTANFDKNYCRGHKESRGR